MPQRTVSQHRVSQRQVPKEVLLYRMKLPDHECPYGLRAKQMLEEAAIPFEDRLLTSRSEVEDFKAEFGVDTTPQLFVDGERIGDSDELEAYLESAER